MFSFFFFLPFLVATGHEPVSVVLPGSEFQKTVNQHQWQVIMPNGEKDGVLHFFMGGREFRQAFGLVFSSTETKEQRDHVFYRTNEDLLNLLSLFHAFELECRSKKTLKKWHFVFCNLQRFLAIGGCVAGLVLLLGKDAVDAASFENVAISVALTGINVFTSRWQYQVNLIRKKREEIDARLGDLVEKYKKQKIQKMFVDAIQHLFGYNEEEEWVKKVPSTLGASRKHLSFEQNRKDQVTRVFVDERLPEEVKRFFNLELKFEGQKISCDFYYKVPFHEKITIPIEISNVELKKDYNQLFSLLCKFSEDYRDSKLFYRIWMERLIFFQNINNFVGAAIGALALGSQNNFTAIISTLITNGICLFIDLFNTFFFERKLNRAVDQRIPIDQALSKLLHKYKDTPAVFLQMRRIVGHVMRYPNAERKQKFPLIYFVFDEYDTHPAKDVVLSKE